MMINYCAKCSTNNFNMCIHSIQTQITNTVNHKCSISQSLRDVCRSVSRALVNKCNLDMTLAAGITMIHG